MKTANILKVLAFAAVAAVLSFGLAACAGNGAKGGGVAAKVNGTDIAEQTVTDTIQNVRKQSGLETEEAWGQFLVSNDMTPESVRTQIVESLVNEQLLKGGAKDLGVTVDSAEVDTNIQSMRANFDSDEKWKEALSNAGFTEESYRETVETSLLQQAVSKHFEDEAKPSDEEVLEAAKTYASYYDGAKRSSHILFAATDEATAQDVLNRINSGSLDFAEAAKQYSTDSSAEKGGDVGWDKSTSFVAAYQEALDGLEVGQVSGLVKSDYGIHIIKCTDVYNAPAEIKSLEDVPEEFREALKGMASTTKANNDYKAWLDSLKEKAEIVTNDMPSNLPYAIDLSKYKSAASEGAASAEAASNESASNESASGESASGESAQQ